MSGQLIRVVEREKAKESEKKESEATAARPENSIDEEPKEDNDGDKKDKLPPESTRDLTPFPLNREYVSHPVLSGLVKEEIWFRIMIEGKSVRQVSSELGVEMARVGAVVRLKEIEKEWLRIGKPLASAYQRYVSQMLPRTLLAPVGEPVQKHESINDLPVHRATGQQIFHPTSESRHFTRVDAARVFDQRLLPADSRVPHPELVIKHKEFNLPREQRDELAAEREVMEEQKRISAIKRQEKKEAAVKKIDTGRWAFHFTEVQVDDAGKTGRGHKGTGWRYGVPLMDRSRGQVKIPTSVG
ncbi:tyrosine phosphatase [Diplocarpon rosae]|nr:tyrosine phosphatase [Diplocarpon rosae]